MNKFKRFAKENAPELILGTVAVGVTILCVVAAKRNIAEVNELTRLFEECYQKRDFTNLPDNKLWIVPTSTLKELTS